MRKWVVATSVVAASLVTLSSPARAAGPQVDWLKVIVDADRMARGGAERPTATNAPRLSGHDRPAVDEPSPQNLGNAWFGIAPRVTLVARDWASSTRLAGERVGFVEQVRLSASTRMVVGRIRFAGPRFTPFLQAGIGQWRTDRNYLPLLPHTMEIASQVGTGFEMRVSKRVQLAAEASVTSLLLDGQNSTLPQTMLWSTLVASRIEF